MVKKQKIIFGALLTSVVFFFAVRVGFVFAYTLGTPHWVEMPTMNKYNFYHVPAGCDVDGPCWDAYDVCDLWTWDAFTPFANSITNYNLYSNSGCTGSTESFNFNFKEAICPVGEVMVGTRMYGIYFELDEEHVDAFCVNISGITLSTSRWVEASNSSVVLAGDYKTATCSPGEIAIGTRMFGIRFQVDDEHVDVLCAVVTGMAPGGNYRWVEAPNAYTTFNGFFKSATCSVGEVMVGLRFFEFTYSVDDEHVDALCYLPPPSSVNIWFGS